MRKKTDDGKKRLVNAKKRRISQNLLVSYLLILLAPVIAIVGIYATARTAMVTTQKERIQNMLSEAELSFDREIGQAQSAGYYVSRERRLSNALLQNPAQWEESEFYTLYKLAGNFPDYSLTNQVIKNVFIFIADSRFVIKIPQVIPQTELGRKTLGGFPFYSYETFMEFYEAQNQSRTLFTDEGENGGRMLFMPVETGYPYGMGKCAVVVELNWNEIMKLLKPVLSGKDGMVAVLDENNRILKGYERHGKEASASETGAVLEDYVKERGFCGRNAVTFTKESGYNGWKLAAVVPKSVMIERIGAVRHFAVALCVTSIFIGIMVCISYWYQRKSIVQEFFEVQARLVAENGVTGDGACGKEGRGFWKKLGQFLNDVDKLQTTVKRQEVVIREDVLRKLLYGTYDSVEQVLEAAGQSGISLTDSFYYVVDLEYEDPFRAGLECTKAEFQELTGEFLERFLPWTYWRYQPSALSCVLLIQNDEKIPGEDLKEALEKMNYEFYSRCKVQSYAGISHSAGSPTEISRQFEIASRISEFARYRGIRVPVLPSELPVEMKKDQPLFFSIDMEMKLMSQMKSGSEEQLDEMLEQIQQVYFRPGNSRYTYRHTIEILRGCILRSIPSEDEGAEAERLRAGAQEARGQEEMFRLLRETRRFCTAAGDGREETAVDLDREKVSAFIEEHYGEPELNLAVAAEWLGKPERKLYNDFKTCFGMSFASYLEQRRIVHACEYLKQGVAVRETAEKVGYGSDYSFRRAFKRVVGIPPSDFRRMQTN